MFHRLSSYHALLELELDESPTGKIYLQEGDIALRVAFELLKSQERALDVHRRDFESVDLQSLVTGVSRRLKKIGQTEFNLDFTHVQDRDSFVWGRLHLLQQFVAQHLSAAVADKTNVDRGERLAVCRRALPVNRLEPAPRRRKKPRGRTGCHDPARAASVPGMLSG